MIKGHCNGKFSYEKIDAQTVRNIRESKGVKGLRIYQCDQCDYWHLTKKEKWDEDDIEYLFK